MLTPGERSAKPHRTGFPRPTFPGSPRAEDLLHHSPRPPPPPHSRLLLQGGHGTRLADAGE
eukprot:4738872-Pyramimonas_sp.AAC.1